MDLMTKVHEIGAFTTIDTLAKFRGEDLDLSPVESDLARYLPINPSCLSHLSSDSSIAESLKTVQGIERKEKVIIAGAELMLLEAIVELSLKCKVYQILDDRLPQASLQRMQANIPQGIECTISSLPTVPFGLSPTGSVLITSGFWGGGNMVLVPESVRAVLLFLKNIYFGEKVLIVPYSKIVHSRPEGWVTVNFSDFFTECTGAPSFFPEN